MQIVLTWFFLQNKTKESLDLLTHLAHNWKTNGFPSREQKEETQFLHFRKVQEKKKKNKKSFATNLTATKPPRASRQPELPLLQTRWIRENPVPDDTEQLEKRHASGSDDSKETRPQTSKSMT
jgi:hypothetical protein